MGNVVFLAVAAVLANIERPDTWRFQGEVNVLLLLVVIGAVFPGRRLSGTRTGDEGGGGRLLPADAEGGP